MNLFYILFFFCIQTNELYFISIDIRTEISSRFPFLQQKHYQLKTFSLFFLVCFMLLNILQIVAFYDFINLNQIVRFVFKPYIYTYFSTYMFFLCSYVLVKLIGFLNVVLLGLKILHARKKNCNEK